MLLIFRLSNYDYPNKQTFFIVISVFVSICLRLIRIMKRILRICICHCYILK